MRRLGETYGKKIARVFCLKKRSTSSECVNQWKDLPDPNRANKCQPCLARSKRFFSPRTYKPTVWMWMWNYLNFQHLQLVQNSFLKIPWGLNKTCLVHRFSSRASNLGAQNKLLWSEVLNVNTERKQLTVSCRERLQPARRKTAKPYSMGAVPILS